MTLHLLDRQLADGSFAGSSHADPLATAAAVAAFSAVLREYGGQANDRLATAQHRGLAALTAMQAEPTAPGFHRPDDRTEDDRALVAAFVLQLLGDDDDFRQALRFADLVNWFEERADRLDADTAALGRPRHSGAPEPSPALAAIAA